MEIIINRIVDSKTLSSYGISFKYLDNVYFSESLISLKKSRNNTSNIRILQNNQGNGSIFNFSLMLKGTGMVVRETGMKNVKRMEKVLF